MHLLPDGDIRACCRNPIPLGNITEQRLPEIWAGVRRAEMEAELAAKATPAGCGNCAAEVATEGRRGSYPEVFDLWANRLGRDRSAEPWPVRMEFNLSNRCNLQCIQCSGDLSSAIRIHRDGRPPLPTVYDDQFFDDLRLFLPHLRHANFAGGEPFLGPENYRVWEAIREVAPRLECTINTNATIWNRRVEEVLERGRFSFIFSLDGIREETYSAIRIDADLNEVLANIERFREHAARHGTDVNINHCLMPQNHAEFGELLLYAEERRIKVNVSVVRTPEECSIAELPRDEIRAIHRTLAAQSAEILPLLRLNASTWTAELKRIGVWAEHGPPPDPDRWEVEAQEVHLRRRPSSGRTVLGLPHRSDVPSDEAAAQERLRRRSGIDSLEWLTVDEAEVVTACTDGLAQALGITPGDLVGRPVGDLQGLVEARYGSLRAADTNPVDASSIDGRADYESLAVHLAIVALRDEAGRAREGRILVALEPS